MTNHLSFPKNYAVYLQKAMEALADNRISQAANFMQEALKIEMDDELLQLCISLLKDLKQPNEALELINTYKSAVYNSSDISPIELEFISLLIDNGQLAEAKKQIKNRWVKLHNGSQNNSVSQILNHQLSYVESKMEQEKLERRIAVIENGQTISKKPYFRQLQFMKELPILPDHQLINLAEHLLIEKGIHSLLKTDILELLQERQIKQTVMVTKDSFKQTFNPLLLTTLSETNFIKEGKLLLENHLGLNEREKSQYLELLFLHVAYYYPFEEPAFKSPAAWLQAILSPGIDHHVEKFIRQAEKGLDSLMT